MIAVWGISMADEIHKILSHCSSLQMSGVVFGQGKTFLTLKTSPLQTLLRQAFLCVDLWLQKHHLGATHHVFHTHNTQHFVQPSATGDVRREMHNVSTLQVLCPSFLKDAPTAKTRMKGLLLPNLEVHLSLQAPSKGCSKNPRKKGITHK